MLSAAFLTLACLLFCGCAENAGKKYYTEPVFVAVGKDGAFKVGEIGAKERFSVEYKVEGSGEFGLALIGDDWGKNYFGYIYFDEDGQIANYEGVTSTLLDDGFISVAFEVGQLNILMGVDRPDTVKVLFIRGDYSNVAVTIRNLSVKG